MTSSLYTPVRFSFKCSLWIPVDFGQPCWVQYWCDFPVHQYWENFFSWDTWLFFKPKGDLGSSFMSGGHSLCLLFSILSPTPVNTRLTNSGAVNPPVYIADSLSKSKGDRNEASHPFGFSHPWLLIKTLGCPLLTQLLLHHKRNCQPVGKAEARGLFLVRPAVISN